MVNNQKMGVKKAVHLVNLQAVLITCFLLGDPHTHEMAKTITEMKLKKLQH